MIMMMKMKPASSLLLLLLVSLVLGLAQLHFSQAKNTPQDFLIPQNAARAQVGVAPLTWNTTIEQYAITYAVLRSRDCQLTLSGGPYGENIFWGRGVGFTDAAKAVELWVAGKSDYDYNSNSCINGDNKCLTYTQVVWRDSTQLGCARVKCATDDAAAFIICNYNPAGNIPGQKPY